MTAFANQQNARALWFLANLIREPPNVDKVRAIAHLLSNQPEHQGAGLCVTCDQLNECLLVEHCTVFERIAVPNSAIYLDPDGISGGAATQAAAHAYQDASSFLEPAADTLLQYGMTWSRLTSLMEPDHLANLLRTAAALWAVLDHLAQDPARSSDADTLRTHLAEFLDSMVLSWFPIYALAVRRLASPFSTMLVDQITDNLLTCRNSLQIPVTHPTSPAIADHHLDPNAPSTTLQMIATWLCHPASSGLMITAHDITAMGRTLDLPRGFGRREMVFGNLMRSAAHLGMFPTLIEHLRDLAQTWQNALRVGRHRHPSLAPLVAPWMIRIANTERILATIKDDAQRFLENAS